MTGLILLFLMVWVFPSECQPFDIPLESALLIRGEPVGFTVPPHRQKRAERGNGTTCAEHEYSPRGRHVKHCCNKCPAGTRVVSHCLREGEKTKCAPCNDETFMASEHGSKYCLSCNPCLQQNGQIVKFPCTRKSDTVCGCPAGQFRKTNDSNFVCHDCSKCQNGTEILPCSEGHDTLCSCHSGFFFDEINRKCRRCSECHDSSCRVFCQPPADHVGKPNDQSDFPLTAVLIMVAVIVLGFVGIVTYFIMSKRSSSEHNVISGTITHPLITDTKTLAVNALPGFVPDCPTIVTQEVAQNTSLPLPDVTLQNVAPHLKSPEVLYKIIECVPVTRWKEFSRRLGLSNNVIDTMLQDNRHYSDAQYAMLVFWTNRSGSSGDMRDQLFKVLREMQLEGCVETIEECL